MSYISNRILYETHNDVFDVNEILKADPNIYPETTQESEVFKKYKTIHQSIFTFVHSIQQRTSIENYQNAYGLEKAYTAYADGLRANSVITQYVQFIKATEALFGGISNKDILSPKVSEITEKKNSKFDADFFYALKDIRDKCEHTHPHSDTNGTERLHISTSDIERIKEVEKNLPDLTEIVKILFDHFKDS